jgi:D-alanyl-D-alanine carboxypeptidase
MREHNLTSLLFVVVLFMAILFTNQKSPRNVNKEEMEFIQKTSVAQLTPAPISKGIVTVPRNDAKISKQSFDKVPSNASKYPAASIENSVPYFFARSPDATLPEVKAQAALAVDLESGQEFLALNPHQRWPVASLTKLMTAVIAKTEIGLEKTITVSETAVSAPGAGGGFMAGESYLSKDLIASLIAVSSNDAAEALAEYYGRDTFIAKMNELASKLSMTETSFKDPTGISPLNQSTVTDLFKLLAFIYKKHPDILVAAQNKETEIRELRSQTKRKLLSNNIFSGRSDFLGGKTGYTEEAGENLVSIFSYLNRPLLIIILGSQDRFGETEHILKWIKRFYSR